MSYRLICFLFIILVITGCSSLSIEEIADTSVAKTKTARPTGGKQTVPAVTATPTPEPLATPSAVVPSDTQSPTVTSTVTQTPTPDLRIIDLPPRNFLMETDDLPPEPNYYLPSSNWISPHKNYEVVNELGEEGERYIQESGRIDGWWVTYKKGSSRAQAPDEIYHNIVKYQSAEGARITVEKYNLATRDEDYQLLDKELPFGDHSVVMASQQTLSDGATQYIYRIETAYRNFVSVVVAAGGENEIDYEFVETMASIMIEKLSQAPLTLPQ